MDQFFQWAVSFVWNKPVVYLCLFGGLFFSLRFLFIQFRCIPHAVGLLAGKYDDPNEKGMITHFQALAAALSGTIGLGNIAGVAVAISMGGPGSVLWMWIVGAFGMATKYVECTLGTHYRHEDPETGEVRGGAMYYIEKGLGPKFKPLAIFFAVAITLASFGSASMFQTNQAASALSENYGVEPLLTGLVLFVLTVFVIIGGIKRIGQVASKVVPLMCVLYVGAALIICFINYDQIPAAFSIIFQDAFTGRAAAGGAIGAVVMMGVKRAIFSNEAGIGSAPIAHAAVKTKYPIREGIVAAMGPLIDTLLVCTATALVIILSGSFGTEKYKAESQFRVGFESATTRALPSGWSLQSSENSPAEKYEFQPFKDGKQVLHYSSNGSEHTSITLPKLPVETGSIRFSYYKEAGDIEFVVLKENGVPIGSFELNKERSVMERFGKQVLHLEGYHWNNRWSSYVVNFDDLEAGNLREGEKVMFQVIPKGNNVSWYFDRFELVSDAPGIALTTRAFDNFFEGFGSIFITFAVFFFAFSTLITWAYYGEVGVYYLTRNRMVVLAYKWIYSLIIIVGAIQTLDVVINFTDTMIGLLVIPNSIALLLLHGKVWEWTKSYFNDLASGKIKAYK
jgi:AGCS family alanine or glycine:cation symporter